MRQFSKTRSVRLSLLGAWCSGITFALHAKGPGFEPRRLHYLFAPAQSFSKFIARLSDCLFNKSKRTVAHQSRYVPLGRLKFEREPSALQID